MDKNLIQQLEGLINQKKNNLEIIQTLIKENDLIKDKEKALEFINLMRENFHVTVNKDEKYDDFPFTYNLRMMILLLKNKFGFFDCLECKITKYPEEAGHQPDQSIKLFICKNCTDLLSKNISLKTLG